MKPLEWKKIREMPVLQATFNPKSLGVARIHMAPPRASLFHNAPALVTINGNDILPIRKGHAILLAHFLEELNQYDGRPIDEENMKNIVDKTIARTRKVYYKTKPEVMAEDLRNLVEDFCRLAYGQPLESQYDIISIGEYGKYLQGPLRMDLMVSAMTDCDGNWHCNNKCLHCYAAGQKLSESRELSTDEWKKVLERMYDAHVMQVTFTGGEPTLRKDLPELIRYAKFFITRVNTNGILLTEEYCKRLAEAELDNLQVTLYSAQEAIHNQLVGNSSWNATVRGIQNAISAGLSVSINTPLCSLNQNYLETLRLIHELGIRYVSCSSIITTGNALFPDAERTQLTQQELISILQKATAFCEEHEMEIAFTSPGWVDAKVLQEMHLQVPTCGACLTNMAITPDGMVVPCQSWLGGMTLGNILQDKWKKVWNSTACQSIRMRSCQMESVCPLRKKGC